MNVCKTHLELGMKCAVEMPNIFNAPADLEGLNKKNTQLCLGNRLLSLKRSAPEHEVFIRLT